MIKLVIQREAFDAMGLDPAKSYTLDLSGCRISEDVQGLTMNDLVFSRGVNPPFEVIDLD